jgi:hypothetical protein
VTSRFFSGSLTRPGAAALLGTVLVPALAMFAADPPPTTLPAVTATTSSWNLPDFIDRLPDFLADRLPGFEPTGALRVYVRPHFGDFIHRDYVRVPVGIRDKITETVEFNAELESYFTHGLGDSAGYGLSSFKFGVKKEHVLPSFADGGISVGINYQTPLSRPPVELNDGYRHFQPYVAATHPIFPAWRVLGYAGVGADFLDSTAIPPHFGRNELHSDSLTFGAGMAREWARFHGAVTATVTTSSLVSDENKQVYALRPEIIIPWKSRTGSKTQVLFTLGGRIIHGPDGTEIGATSSVRIEFQVKPGAK